MGYLLKKIKFLPTNKLNIFNTGWLALALNTQLINTVNWFFSLNYSLEQQAAKVVKGMHIGFDSHNRYFA